MIRADRVLNPRVGDLLQDGDLRCGTLFSGFLTAVENVGELDPTADCRIVLRTRRFLFGVVPLVGVEYRWNRRKGFRTALGGGGEGPPNNYFLILFPGHGF